MRRPTLPLSRRFLCLLAPIGLLAACSPTLNWRDVDVGPQTRVQFPCRPEHAERALVLADAPTRAGMWVCDAGGLSWSATVLDVDDPSHLSAVLRASRLGLATRLQGSEESVQPVRIAGMTPNDESRRVVIVGPAGTGQPARAEAVFAVRGLQVFQFVVMAQRGAPPKWAESADEFLRSVRWPG
ncbi:hypothetical protein [uncultured Sphaerotilus sp.]|uniref:hypothetical protein n=1 Tax=uncultured Sphaerotilus sp. TaxID=474984 RepID=UPI0030CA36E0